MTVNYKDLGAGAIFIFVGLLYGSLTWYGLPIGRALNMGPGYFPLVLSGVVALLGLVIAGRAFTGVKVSEPLGILPWRGIFMLSLATIFFAAFVEKVGLLLGVFVTTFLASRANPRVHAARAAITGVCVALFCTVIFGYGIRLPIPVLGDWLRW